MDERVARTVRMARKLVLIACLHACAAGGLTEEFGARPEPTSRGHVVFFRRDYSAGETVYVVVGGRIVGAVPANYRLTIALPPGMHEVGSPTVRTKLDLKAEQTVYLLFEQGFFVSGWGLHVLDEAQAERWLAQTQEANTRRISKAGLPYLEPTPTR